MGTKFIFKYYDRNANIKELLKKTIFWINFTSVKGISLISQVSLKFPGQQDIQAFFSGTQG